VYTDKKKFGKVYTIIKGIDTKEIDIKELTKKLKSKFACGGTTKEGRIELQGNHKQKVRDVLLEAGFTPDTIDIK
jgi:translation initiation factor 1